MSVKKDKTYFIELGRADAAAGREPQLNNGFWQAQAYMEGWNVGKDEKPDTVQVAVEDALVVEPVVPALTKKAKHHTLTVTPIVFEKHTPAPSAVLQHMNWLRNEALACKDAKRAQRLLDKRGTLASKWAKRVEARG